MLAWSWSAVRAPIRGDRQATDRYVQRLVLMAQVLDAQGHPALLRTLEGDRDDNPVFHWNETFAKSRHWPTRAGMPTASRCSARS
jgi:hypothetical protein